MENSKPKDKSSRFELFIAGLGAAACIAITVTIWISLVSYQSIWLLPGAYFLELMTGAILCILSFLYCFQRASLVSWIYSGVLVVFIVLAGFTVGFLYIPVFIIFGGLSIYSDLKHKKPIFAHLGIFLCAGILQSGVMLAVIQLYML
jgi:hypothetical protein